MNVLLNTGDQEVQFEYKIETQIQYNLQQIVTE
jgi:hypothetical protein